MLDLHKTASGGTAGQFLLELSPPSPQRGVMGVIISLIISATVRWTELR